MQAKGSVFIVEDRDSLRRLMERALTQEGYGVTTAAAVGEAIRRLGEERFDLVLTDLKLPDGSGLEVLQASREHQTDVPVVVLTAFGTVSTAVEAMKLGAVDFLEKPLEIDELCELARSLVGDAPPGVRPSGPAAFEVPGAPPIVGRHPKLAAALHLLRKVAPTESTVLVTGESGTGKELFARALHALSPRSGGPLVAVNCAAIPETLMENELFGHEKGAFTGAAKRQPGRFELAAGGTIFLDEIGELKPELQGKVLRVLEERTFERVGGGRPLKADVRVVAATNRRLEEMTARGEFRQDLFYRLDVFPIVLPPLRQRRSDIPHLARHLTEKIRERLRLPPRELAADAVRLLTAQSWPGNVRQLANLLERCLILSEREVLDARDLEPHLGAAESGDGGGEDERRRIRQALLETAGDKHRAAARLKTSYRTLQRKIRALDLEGFPKYRD
ncbi:MAG: sigma-54 dependent transcriptional regulator [Thermoanaerobaculia bacterium]